MRIPDAGSTMEFRMYALWLTTKFPIQTSTKMRLEIAEVLAQYIMHGPKKEAEKSSG